MTAWHGAAGADGGSEEVSELGTGVSVAAGSSTQPVGSSGGAGITELDCWSGTERVGSNTAELVGSKIGLNTDE